MTGKEFLEWMKRTGGETAESKKQKKEAEEADEKYWRELSDLVEKHPIHTPRIHR